MSNAIQGIMAQPWLIRADALETIVAIANRQEDVNALIAKVGKPLEKTRRVEMHGKTAVIPVVGPIMRYASLFDDICGATSTELLAQELMKAVENPKVSEIVLSMDSPGGQAAGIAELAQMIAKLKMQKPIIAYVDNMAASAAYWIASPCNHIAGSLAAMVGSIGVVMTFKKPDDKSNSIEIVSSISPKKRPDILTEKGQAQFQTWADKLGDIFVAEVAKNRGVTKDKVLNDFGQGDCLIGHDALEAGMIDEVTTFEDLLQALKN